jgi:Flp pilus assembly protein TadG
MAQTVSDSAQPKRSVKRGQSTIELALVLPLLVLLLSVVIEAGLALNAWIRVSTAARDATRFAVDAGRPSDTASLVLTKLTGLDQSQLTVFIITVATDSNGNITTWSVDRRVGSGTRRVQQSDIQQRIAVAGNPQASQNLELIVVEVDYNYSPLLATLVARGATIPMTSFAIIKQY